MSGLEYFSGYAGKLLVIRLDPGDLLLESVEEVARREGFETAVVLSGIGTLDRCYLHAVTTTGYPVREQKLVFEGVPLELLSLQGVVAGGKAHLHAVVSDTKGAYGGHVEEGCRVLYLAEIVVLGVDGLTLARIPDERGIGRLRKKP
ncbi:MAG: DNA-binding protein [Thermofilaceae archaeon]